MRELHLFRAHPCAPREASARQPIWIVRSTSGGAYSPLASWHGGWQEAGATVSRDDSRWPVTGAASCASRYYKKRCDTRKTLGTRASSQSPEESSGAQNTPFPDWVKQGSPAQKRSSSMPAPLPPSGNGSSGDASIRKSPKNFFRGRRQGCAALCQPAIRTGSGTRQPSAAMRKTAWLSRGCPVRRRRQG